MGGSVGPFDRDAVVHERHARELVAGERKGIEAALHDLLGGVHSQDLLGIQQAGETDQGSQLATEMVERSLILELRRELAAVERAEQRIAAGTFGISIDSGRPIPSARLDAVPMAEGTVDEQRRLDGDDAG